MRVKREAQFALPQTNGQGRRIVITGIGLLSPAGNTLEDFWRGITCGESAVREIDLFDLGDMPIRSGGQVDTRELVKEVGEVAVSRTDRAVLMGAVAAGRALDDAGLREAVKEDVRCGCIVGSGFGPIHALEERYISYVTKGWQAIRPTTIPRCMFNSVASHISIEHGLRGGHQVVAAACSSGSMAMINAYDAIRSGHEDVVLTGGCDAPILHSIHGSWINLRILSKNPVPEKASRPFDRKRDGLVLAEGAAMLVFEELEHARARGARIHAEMLGYGMSSDARHLTNPGVDGQAASIRQALETCGIGPGDVDYINAHGTSTILNDKTETQAIKTVLGERARHVPISSTKSVTGHAMGASSPMGMIATALAMRHSTAPPTVNLENPDPECDLDYVPQKPRPAPIALGLCNTFGFGGANAVLVIRAFDPHFSPGLPAENPNDKGGEKLRRETK